MFILWNKFKFSPCKNSVLDLCSNHWHSPRQHMNYHKILTGHLCEIHKIILCSSWVFVCWAVRTYVIFSNATGHVPRWAGRACKRWSGYRLLKNVDWDEDNNKLTKVNPQLTQRFGNIQSEIFRPSPEIIAFVNMI